MSSFCVFLRKYQHLSSLRLGSRFSICGGSSLSSWLNVGEGHDMSLTSVTGSHMTPVKVVISLPWLDLNLLLPFELEGQIRQFLVARFLVCCHFWVSFVLWLFQFASNFSFDACSLFFACLAHFVRVSFLHTHDACSLASVVLS